MLSVGREIGRRSILIPTTDDTAIFLASYADALRDSFIFPRLNARIVRSLCSKREMYYLAKKYNVPTAEAVFPQCKEDVLNFSKDATFPIILKAIRGSRLQRRVGRTMAIAQTRNELLSNYEAMEDPEEPNLMLQEYIPGDDDTIWMFNGYFNESSDCVIGLTGRKLRQWPVHQGVTSLGLCVGNPTVEKATKDFMKAIGYTGILDAGYRYDARDGRYKVLDINPRIGATFRLFVADDGMDVARALYLDITKQPMSTQAATDGRKWFVEDYDVQSFVRDRKLSFARWIASYRGVREAAYFAADDPGPFLQMLVRNIYRMSLFPIGKLSS